MFMITLNKEAAAVLLRCLRYGQAAISQQEHENGVADVVTENIEIVRKSICSALSDQIITETSEKKKEKDDAE